MTDQRITINRAPVLTLWAAVVAERLGLDRDEALTIGRALSGLTAHAKGVRLGIFEPTSPERIAEHRRSLAYGDSTRFGPPAEPDGPGTAALPRGAALTMSAVHHHTESHVQRHPGRPARHPRSS
jgi:hypothetical protein